MDKQKGKNNDTNFVIVVGRQYGSGGRRIGKMLADALSVSYYDKTLLSEAARSLGYSSDIFERADEKRPSVLRSLLSFSYGATNSGYGDSAMSDENLYAFQSKVIKDICSRESCVIVGRTADYVMRHHPRIISIFIHAPLEARTNHVLKREKEVDSADKAVALIKKMDRSREAYYNYYTNRNWGHCSNYHFSFDSTKFTDEAIIATVKAALNL
ncbi:MAG: cytidylate kinase-like family protein [Candidatus Amulumruptor caecigallinarius]|nr:cytidylate kinase-like family protein [Candidatus Amulumruptor caecigallinarius]